MLNRTISVRTAVMVVAVAFGVAALLLPAKSQQGPRVGWLNILRVRQQAKVFQDLGNQLQDMQKKQDFQVTCAEGFMFLVDAEGQRATELEMKGNTRTPEENQELLRLKQKSDALFRERDTLMRKADNARTKEDDARLSEISTIRTKRRTEIDALKQKLGTDLEAKRVELISQKDNIFVAALGKVKEQNGLDIVLVSHVPYFDVNDQGRAIRDFLPVVYAGGKDVTDQLITQMNGSPPPAMTDEEKRMFNVPFSVQ